MNIPDDDPELESIAKAQKAKKRNIAIGVVLVVIVGAFKVIPMSGAVVSTLEEDGHTDVQVTRKGLFDFSYASTKGATTCSGSVTLMPGSSRRTGMCTSKR